MQPSDYDLPPSHNEWRKGQEETIGYCLGVDGTSIIESPTGSGKTSFAAAVASEKSVVSLCRTKNLQSENYGRTYDFDVLYGKANYPCVHPDSVRGATCADCLHEDNMYKCAVARSCEYLRQKALCKASPKVSLNYAYWMTSVAFRQNPPQVLFLDECHELADVVTSFCGATVTERDRIEWQLSNFPELKPSSGGGMLTKVVDPLPVALGWLEDTRNVLRRHWKRLKHASTEGELRRKRKCEQLGRKVGNTLDALRRCPDDWYIKSGRRAQKFGREHRPAFVCRPLTSRHHYRNYFTNSFASILMSATIGEPNSFANELGISDFQFLSVPNQFKPEERSVYTLPNVPSMGSKASQSAFECQADEIASVILDCPPDWSWLTLVTRKRESRLLGDRLARRGLQDRIWVPEGHEDGSYTPTDKQIESWHRRLARKPNSIAIGWNFWTGYDGQRERGLIVAKTPWPIWGSGSSYNAEWRRYSRERYNHAAAVKLMQGAGRTRRGELDHYDVGGEFNGFVCVADGSWSRLKKYYSQDFLDSVVEV